MFNVIVYTSEDMLKDEIFYLNDLLVSGVEQLHLRKPQMPKYVLENLLVNIDPRFHNKIVLHSHYDLLDKYELRGIHLTQKYIDKSPSINLETIIKVSKVKGYLLGKPVHKLDELSKVTSDFDYVTLSPIFDSISKKDYLGQFGNITDLRKFKGADFKVYALGGICMGNINLCYDKGFDGAVLMGALWSGGDPVKNYLDIKNTIYQVG